MQSTMTFDLRGSIACVLVTSLIFTSAAKSSTDDGSTTLPSLRNSSSVGLSSIYIQDKNRLDPFTIITQHRQLIISMFHPIDATASGPPLELNPRPPYPPFVSPLATQYMPNGTAAVQGQLAAYDGIPNGAYERLQTLCQFNVPFSANKPTYPLMVFSPDYTNSRLLYTTMVQEIARNGYVVVAVDHPYDAKVIEFGNNILVEFTEYTPNLDMETSNTVRAQDISTAFAEIEKSSAKNTTSLIAFDHGLGGASALLNDTRIAAGLNFDGNFYGSLLNHSTQIKKPFLQF